MDPGEGCDDGNTITETCAYGEASCDVCDDQCQLVAGTTRVCGDAVVDPEEECDDGNTVTEACIYGEASCVVCDAQCASVAGETSTCGDDVIDAAHEDCDDGNATTEACAYGDVSCTVCDDGCHDGAGLTSFCGDGNVDAANGEGCDDANTVTEMCAYGLASCTVCDASCAEVAGEVSLCGDEVVQPGSEDCDDGNATTEACAYGEASCSVCDGTCHTGPGTTSVCGDGVVDAANGEQCDDSNTVTEKCAYGLTSCTVCDATCQSVAGAPSYCGDGVVDTTNGEDCEDGNAIANDGCEANCQFVCGHGSGGSKAFLKTPGCFVRFDTVQNHTSALAACNAIGMTLATIHGATTNALVVPMIGNTITWIGLNDIATEGSFVWDNGDAVVYTNWNAGEPNNSNNEDCTEMLTSGLWNDGQCTTARRFLCEDVTCGDNVLDANEACDDGNHVTETCAYGQTSCGSTCGDACTMVTAKTTYCGDLKVDAANLEVCDDGNGTAGDGCSSCQVDTGWVCYGTGCAQGTEYAAGPGLGLTVSDNGYNGTIGSMTCADVSVTTSGDGIVDSVAMRIGMTHTFVGDLTMKVFAPDGTTVTVLSLPGTTESADNGTGSSPGGANLSASAPLFFGDAFTADAETMSSGLTTTQTVWLDNGVCSFKPNKGAASGGTLASFAGHAAAGTWKVCVGDSVSADVGTIDRVSLVIQQ